MKHQGKTNKKRVISLMAIVLMLCSLTVRAEKIAPAKESPTPPVKTGNVKPSEIVWHNYADGLALAKKEGKNIFVEFWTKWCGYCRKMKATTFKDPGIIEILNKNYINISVNGESSDSLNVNGWITNGRGLAREYRITGYPTYWFLTPEGERIAPVTGYRPAATLHDFLDYLKDDLYKKVEFKDFLEQRKKKEEEKTSNKL